MSDLYAFLDAHGIAYQRCDHPAVFTVAEAARLVPPLPGAHTKNLFLRDRKGDRHFLVVVPAEKRVDLGALPAVLGATKLSLGSPERLVQRLGIEPGSVSLLALYHDRDHAVELFIDEQLWQETAFQCHPLVNTATLVIPREGVERFLRATGHVFRLVAVPGHRAGPADG